MVLGLPLLSGNWLSVHKLAKRAGVAANPGSRWENGSGAMVDTLARSNSRLKPQAWFSASAAIGFVLQKQALAGGSSYMHNLWLSTTTIGCAFLDGLILFVELNGMRGPYVCVR